MKYLDTSVVVSLFERETTTERAIQWLEHQDRTALAGSDWLWTEVSSALARKVRTGRLSSEDHLDALSRIRLGLAPQIINLPIAAVDFQTAASFCDRSETSLRAGDALHLAVAVRAGYTLVTMDKRLASAASQLGRAAELIE